MEGETREGFVGRGGYVHVGRVEAEEAVCKRWLGWLLCGKATGGASKEQGCESSVKVVEEHGCGSRVKILRNRSSLKNYQAG